MEGLFSSEIRFKIRSAICLVFPIHSSLVYQLSTSNDQLSFLYPYIQHSTSSSFYLGLPTLCPSVGSSRFPFPCFLLFLTSHRTMWAIPAAKLSVGGLGQPSKSPENAIHWFGLAENRSLTLCGSELLILMSVSFLNIPIYSKCRASHLDRSYRQSIIRHLLPKNQSPKRYTSTLAASENPGYSHRTHESSTEDQRISSGLESQPFTTFPATDNTYTLRMKSNQTWPALLERRQVNG
jgi:hypothetical protein